MKSLNVLNNLNLFMDRIDGFLAAFHTKAIMIFVPIPSKKKQKKILIQSKQVFLLHLNYKQKFIFKQMIILYSYLMYVINIFNNFQLKFSEALP